MTCEICHGESGGAYAGVASIPGVPVSISWCTECLKRDTAPAFVFEHDFIFVAGGDLTQLHPWALERETWADGKYMKFTEYVKRFTPEYVQHELAREQAYDEELGAENNE